MLPGILAGCRDDNGCISLFTIVALLLRTAFLLAMQMFLGQPPSGGRLPVNGTGTLNIGDSLAADQALTGLKSDTNYTLCAIAADSTLQQNKQTTVSSVTFKTLDITPPELSLTMVAGTDGNVSCERQVVPALTCDGVLALLVSV
jgi:hypothetical protein